MKRVNSYLWPIVGAVLVGGLWTAARAEEAVNEKRTISLRRVEDKPRRYDSTIEMHDTMMHVGRGKTKKTQKQYGEDIPEARQKDLPMAMPMREPTPYEFQQPQERPTERRKTRNWILPPKPDDLEDEDYSSDPVDLLREAIREEDAARRSVLDSLYSDRNGPFGREDAEEDEDASAYDLRGNRLRKASDNLLYTEEEEYDMLMGADEETNDSEPLEYEPVVSDRVRSSEPSDRRGNLSVEMLTDEELENMSPQELERLAARAQGNEEDDRGVSVADEEDVPGLIRFTRGDGSGEGGLWQTREMLSRMNESWQSGANENPESRQAAQVDATSVSDSEWKGTFTTLTKTLEASESYHDAAASRWSIGGVEEEGIQRYNQQGLSSFSRSADADMNRIRGQFEAGGVQPTSDFSRPGSSGFGGIGGSVSRPTDIGSGLGGVFTTTASGTSEPAPEPKNKRLDMKNLKILMN